MSEKSYFYNGWKPTGGINYHGKSDPMEVDEIRMDTPPSNQFSRYVKSNCSIVPCSNFPNTSKNKL